MLKQKSYSQIMDLFQMLKGIGTVHGARQTAAPGGEFNAYDENEYCSFPAKNISTFKRTDLCFNSSPEIPCAFLSLINDDCSTGEDNMRLKMKGGYGKVGKRMVTVLLALVVGISAWSVVIAAEQEGAFEGLGVFFDRGDQRNHYAASGWMGDYGDIKFSEACKDNPHSGKTCIKIDYTAEGKQGAHWAGIYWQWPPNNWGEKKGGYDLSGAKKLVFWARGEKGGEQIMEFKIGGLTGTYSDTDSASIGPIQLTKDWQEYSIDLADLDVSYISGGFAWVTSAMANPDGCAFYLDDIRYE